VSEILKGVLVSPPNDWSADRWVVLAEGGRVVLLAEPPLDPILALNGGPVTVQSSGGGWWDVAGTVPMQSANGYRVGDRVRVTFADPTAARNHEGCVGRVGTVRAIQADLPQFLRRLDGTRYPTPWGCLTIQFDRPIDERDERGCGSVRTVEYLFPHELNLIESGHLTQRDPV